MMECRYVDIHSHLLPGADDGAKTQEESIAMLMQAQREGIGTIIVTPHQKPGHRCITPEKIREGIDCLQAEMRQQHIDIKLFAGSELFYSHDLSEKLRVGTVLPLAGSHYVLVEFLPNEDWRYIRDGLYRLGSGGYWPILAHVERYAALREKKERVQELIDLGCYIQMNAGSLTGENGLQTRLYCSSLIGKHQIHFIATDAHRSGGRRSPQMKKCAEWLGKKAGREYAKQLLWENAERILADKEV